MIIYSILLDTSKQNTLAVENTKTEALQKLPHSTKREKRPDQPSTNCQDQLAAISSATRVCLSSLHLESELLARLGGGGEGVSFGGRRFKPWQTSVAFAQLHFTFARVCQLWWLEREILGIHSTNNI
jgi:hypothetical protein